MYDAIGAFYDPLREFPYVPIVLTIVKCLR
jgi:hypothetical protein